MQPTMALQALSGDQLMWSFAVPNLDAIEDRTVVAMNSGDPQFSPENRPRNRCLYVTGSWFFYQTTDLVIRN